MKQIEKAAVGVLLVFCLAGELRAQSDQAITFSAIASRPVDSAPFALSATSTSNLPVTFTVISGPVTLNGSMVTLDDTGPVTIEANQAGDPSFNPAAPVRQSFNIFFPSTNVFMVAFKDATVGDAPVTITAYAPSERSLQYTVLSGPGTLTGGNKVQINGGGDIVIQASVIPFQTGVLLQGDPAPAQRTLHVKKLDQTIAFAALDNKFVTDPPIALSAAATSLLPVSFSVVSGGASVSGSTLTLTAPGLVTVRASQAGNGTFNAAPNVDRTFTVFDILKFTSGPSYDYTAKTFSGTLNIPTAVITWNFGDGAPQQQGNTVPHTYAADGVYLVTATGFDVVSNQTVIAGLTVTISTPPPPPPTPTPSVPPPVQFRVRLCQMQLDPGAGTDKIAIKGIVHVPGGLTLAGLKAALDIGGIVHDFMLDDKGGASGADFEFQLFARTKNGLTISREVPFSATFSPGDFLKTLRDNALPPPDGNGPPAKVLVKITLNGKTLTNNMSMRFKTAHSSGFRGRFGFF